MKGFWNRKVVCTVISGFALVVAASIGVAHHYLLKGEGLGKDRIRQVQVPLLEKQPPGRPEKGFGDIVVPVSG